MEINEINLETLLKCPNKENANKESKLAIKLPTQTGQIASAGNYIFYGNTQEISIVGIKKPDNNMMTLAQDFEKLQAIPSMKVSNYWNRLMVCSNKFHRYAVGTANISETNFRYCELDLKEIQKLMN
ncbi:PREDICTED: uncharacterized protein LOC105461504 [Wasmannia auropunctata]|uniref:uncharacterized protein LOC105461504 n=1 Tax=Wasmannia auropunctata TaxID=64793 RepID=UPI0005EEA4A2|nr:PREDICTED: uncharacterized protein LOC105461504 [Wasmannia auropunctata]